MLAAMHNHAPVARALITGGASLNLTNNASRTAAHMAARTSSAVLQLLLTAGGKSSPLWPQNASAPPQDQVALLLACAWDHNVVQHR